MAKEGKKQVDMDGETKEIHKNTITRRLTGRNKNPPLGAILGLKPEALRSSP